MKLLLAATAAAVTLSACGVNTAKPLAGTSGPNGKPIGRGRIDDPRTNVNNHLACLLSHHLPAVDVGQTSIQVGALPAGPTIVFEPTAGVAQGDQIQGKAQAAEVIGSALLYPNQAPDRELSTIETCLAVGVSG